MNGMTMTELIALVLDLKAKCDDLKTQVINCRLEITDMTNSHGIAFGNLQDKYDSLLRKLNPKEK